MAKKIENMNKKSREKLLAKTLSLIMENPGIRPSKLNRLLSLDHSAGLRATLIKKGFIRKKKVGTAVFYYPK